MIKSVIMKKVRLKVFLVIIAVSFISAGIFFLSRKHQQENIFLASQQLMAPTVSPTSTIKTDLSPTSSPKPTPTPQPEIKHILHQVPFTSQAPLAEWSDPRQQDGCEEASAIMAIAWVKNEPLGTPQQNRDLILNISDWENETFGPGHDTSAQDTANRILNQYFGWKNYEVTDLVSPQQIVEALRQDRLVITPMNGRALSNPNFTQPGPERHMLVVIGYNPEELEFITNDPGTRNGKSYRYPVSVFWEAIRDYPTGDHEPIEKVEKRMIVVSQ